MVHSISVCFMIYIYYPKCNNMFFWQEWSMINIGGLRRILMDIDGLRWFSGVSAKKLSVLTFWATWPCLKFSSPAGPASFGKKGLCWNCPWAYHSSRVSRGVGFCHCLRSVFMSLTELCKGDDVLSSLPPWVPCALLQGCVLCSARHNVSTFSRQQAMMIWQSLTV